MKVETGTAISDGDMGFATCFRDRRATPRTLRTREPLRRPFGMRSVSLPTWRIVTGAALRSRGKG